MSSDKQVDRIAPTNPPRSYRGPRFQPLRRAVKLPVWGDLGIRLGLAVPAHVEVLRYEAVDEEDEAYLEPSRDR